MKSTKREGKRADNAVSLYFYPIRRKITTPLEIQGERRAFIDILNMSDLFRLEEKFKNNTSQCCAGKRSDKKYPYLIESDTAI